MAQTPDEKTYVEIPFIEQLKAMGRLKESILITTKIPALTMTVSIRWSAL
ncbi:MAG: hypothetical protein KAT52_08065 [Desulfobacterales bacterium]|jgi:hypothetical protein|nr:hypothetical protein [Desulfobacterales bacterium]